MNRAFLLMMKSLFVVALVFSSLTVTVFATDVPVIKPDPSKGEMLYTNGDTARNITACISCHGAAGASTITQNPKLGGQHAVYIYKQLVDFQSASRNSPIMSPLTKALTDDEMKNIAAYLGAQKTKPGAAKNKDTLELGKKIYRAGVANRDIPACASCHGPNGAGMPNQYPRLGGQHQDYTLEELNDFSNGKRKNNQAMNTIAHRMSDEEMKAVADYIAGLK